MTNVVTFLRKSNRVGSFFLSRGVTKWQNGLSGMVFDRLEVEQNYNPREMKNSGINFSVDRTSATEGESVVVAWDCGVPDSVSLTIDNGYSSSRLQLADSGSRVIMVGRSKGTMKLRLTVAAAGRIERRELSIKVKNLRTVKAKTARPKNRPQFSPKGLFGRVATWARNVRQRFSYAWRVMPAKQKRIYIIMLLVLAALWIGALSRDAGYRAGYERGLMDASRPAAGYTMNTRQL